jgi:DNA-binding transcriptional MerR regulator
MQIGIVAKKVGLSVDAIRFYERNALLPQPSWTQGGFRRYAERDVETLTFIRRVQGLRFKLSEKLRVALTAHPQRVRGRKTFVDLALGIESHVKRHMIHLTTARKRIWSYLEHGDLTAIEQLTVAGFPILRRTARNTAEHKVDHRVVFGFAYQTAPQLVSFLRKHRVHMEHVTGVRYSGEFGHPFHVVDDDLVILSLDHPFIPEGRFASLLVRDQELAQNLADGFQKLWSKAMRSLQEIDFHPGVPVKQK